jgi:hypothetical protein
MPEVQAPPSVTGANRRRSQRVMLSVPIVVAGLDAGGSAFREEARTLIVNAHGALINLTQRVALGQTLVLKNQTTEEEQGCRVVFLGDPHEGGTHVGVEFDRAAPHFWPVNFLPDDWKQPKS